MAAIDDAIQAVGQLKEAIREAGQAAAHSSSETQTSVQAAHAFGATDLIEATSQAKEKLDEVSGKLTAVLNEVEEAETQLIQARES